MKFSLLKFYATHKYKIKNLFFFYSSVLTIFSFAACKTLLAAQPDLLSVEIVGHNHMGKNYSISEFYVNDYWGGNVGREGGGGGKVCCIKISVKWRPGLKGDLRWGVLDWTDMNEHDPSDISKLKWKIFRATVPVEKYDKEPLRLGIHFFAGGKVRIIAGSLRNGDTEYHDTYGDIVSSSGATQGKEFDSMFSEKEMIEKLQKLEDYRGRWR